MFHASCPPQRLRAGLGLSALLAAGLIVAILIRDEAKAAFDPPGVAPGSQTPRRTAIGPVPDSALAGGEHLTPPLEFRGREDEMRPSRSLLLRRSSNDGAAGGSDRWYLGMVGITLALAVCGGTVAVSRRFSPRGCAGDIRIVSRVCLSPKHSVYLLRVGARLFLIGAGPQSPPALIGELDGGMEIGPTSCHGAEA
jgi:hypothetical protein